MIAYQPTDTISISDFEFAWRITDTQLSSLPERILNRIKPFSAHKSKEVLDKSPSQNAVGHLFDPAQYHATRQVSLEGEGGCEHERVKQWLLGLPVPPNQEVYLCWQVGAGVAAATDWSTFAEIWDDLWYPFDRLCIFDETRQWAVLLGPEPQAVFIERNA